MKNKNAIILAAGRSNRFAPFTYEKPKGLFRVRGEILIERQIEQLIAAGISEILVVVGFMKEKYFFLEQKYPCVHLIVNNTFATCRGNLYSLYVAKEHLCNTYICCADQYFVENPFCEESPYSYRACEYKSGKYNEFSVKLSDVNAITEMGVGGADSIAMVGHAYFTESFSCKIKQLMEREIDNFGVSNMFWEEFYSKHRKDLTLFAKLYPTDAIQEFDSVDDLRQFDGDFLNNINSEIVVNICKTLSCNPNDIVDIEVIQKGLTNVSFKFTAKGVVYVYRHPGGTSGKLVDRPSELFAQYKALELGIDKSVIYMDASGWKISYCVQDLIKTDFTIPMQFDKAISYIKLLHASQWDESVKIFDTYEEGLKLLRFAANTKGNLETEFAEIIKKAQSINLLLKNDGLCEYVLCHNDLYEPNYLTTSNGDMYLIDWEYAGINDKSNDIAAILCRGNFTDSELDRYIKAYYGDSITAEEYRHAIASIALCAFYWFSWGLYKGAVNDDDGFFFLPAYRSCIRYMDKAIESYK